MNNDILDDFTLTKRTNPNGFKKLLILFGATIFLYLLLTIFELEFLQNSSKKIEEISTITIIFFFLIFLISSIQTAKYTNQYNPNLNELVIVLFSGLYLFLLTCIFKFLVSIIIYGQHFNQNYFSYIKPSLLMAAIGMPISNIKIKHLRKKKLIWSIVVFILVWAYLVYQV